MEPASSKLYSKEELQKLTVPKLKDLLRKNKLKLTGLKAELIQRLIQNKVGKDIQSEESKTKEPASEKTEEITPLKLEGLPDDKIFELCEQLNDKDLGRFISVSKKIRGVCQPLLDKRKIKFEEEQLFERREQLYAWILHNLSETVFNNRKRYSGEVLGFKRYGDFANFQMNKIFDSDENQLAFYEIIRDDLIPIGSALDLEEMIEWDTEGFVFNSHGGITFLTAFKREESEEEEEIEVLPARELRLEMRGFSEEDIEEEEEDL